MPISLVASVSKASNGTSSAIDTTGASLIVLVAGYIASGASSTTRPTVSDSKGNYYHRVDSPGGSNGAVNVFVAVNPTVGSGHTFTCGSGGLPSFCVGAFSGAHLSTPILPTTTFATVTATSVQPGSLTPPVDNCLLIAALGYRDTTTVSVNESFTIAEQQPFDSGTAVGSCLAYKVQTTAAAQNPQFSWTNSAGATAQLVALQPPSGGGAHAHAFFG